VSPEVAAELARIRTVAERVAPPAAVTQTDEPPRGRGRPVLTERFLPKLRGRVLAELQRRWPAWVGAADLAPILQVRRDGVSETLKQLADRGLIERRRLGPPGKFQPCQYRADPTSAPDHEPERTSHG
jgi:hypothetical protein